MTKTLTEQWEKKRIKDGMYYVMADRYELGEYEPTIAECYCCKFNWDIVKEVLAPVPSYDEYKQLVSKTEQLEKRLDIYKRAIEQTDRIEKCLNQEGQIIRLQEQLRIATKALKEYMTFCRHPAEEALKEMKGVK